LKKTKGEKENQQEKIEINKIFKNYRIKKIIIIRKKNIKNERNNKN
jgi:hypothetical protein